MRPKVTRSRFTAHIRGPGACRPSRGQNKIRHHYLMPEGAGPDVARRRLTLSGEMTAGASSCLALLPCKRTLGLRKPGLLFEHACQTLRSVVAQPTVNSTGRSRRPERDPHLHDDDEPDPARDDGRRAGDHPEARCRKECRRSGRAGGAFPTAAPAAQVRSVAGSQQESDLHYHGVVPQYASSSAVRGTSRRPRWRGIGARDTIVRPAPAVRRLIARTALPDRAPRPCSRSRSSRPAPAMRRGVHVGAGSAEWCPASPPATGVGVRMGANTRRARRSSRTTQFEYTPTLKHGRAAVAGRLCPGGSTPSSCAASSRRCRPCRPGPGRSRRSPALSSAGTGRKSMSGSRGLSRP